MEIANIDSGGVQTRLVRTVVAFAAAFTLIALLQALSAPALVYALVFLPFSGAFMLAYQALFKT